MFTLLLALLLTTPHWYSPFTDTLKSGASFVHAGLEYAQEYVVKPISIGVDKAEGLFDTLSGHPDEQDKSAKVKKSKKKVSNPYLEPTKSNL